LPGECSTLDLECPHGYFSAPESTCTGPVCNALVDTYLCCAVAAPCANLTCPYDMVPKLDTSAIYCDGMPCVVERDKHTCCDGAMPCGGLASCLLGYTLKSDPFSIFCDGVSCDAVRDRDTCCDVAAPCTDLGACPYGFVLKPPPVYCLGTACDMVRDQSTCCEDSESCVNYTCPHGFMLKPDPDTRFCAAVTCAETKHDLDECCGVGVRFQFYRWTPIGLRMDPNEGPNSIMQIADLYFYYLGETLSYTGASVFVPGSMAPVNEQPDNVLDGDPDTKWHENNKRSITVRFPAPVFVDFYSWTTANDVPERDPIKWKLEGSFDEVEFYLLDEVNDGVGIVPLSRLTALDPMSSKMPCVPPHDVPNSNATAICAEGALIISGAVCNVQCLEGFAPQPNSTLVCNQGYLIPWEVSCE